MIERKDGSGFMVLWGALCLLTVGCGSCDGPKSGEEAGVITQAAKADREVVIFVVLDTVRSDHLSVCGYERPTSRTLEKLKTMGAGVACNAYAPSTWTLPSHGSFFTGEEVHVHGADNVLAGGPDGGVIELEGHPMRPLSEDFSTLAEQMKARGFRTIAVSGNPVVSRWSATGLTRGFDEVVEIKRFGALYGDALVGEVARALAREADSQQPLFLFVNISDAHQPWFPVPPSIEWLGSRPGMDVGLWEDDSPFVKYVRGQLSDEDSAVFRTRMNDAYDYAVYRADRTLGRVIDALYRQNLLGKKSRLVVTSDHGEFLGEHGLVSHFTFVYEEDVRVPLIYWSGGSGEAPRMEEPISAIAAYDLALEGRLPQVPRPVRSFGRPVNLMVQKFGKKVLQNTAASWRGSSKLLWVDGAMVAVDLKADPGEQDPQAVPADDPLGKEFMRFVESAGAATAATGDTPPEMLEALKALGYTR